MQCVDTLVIRMSIMMKTYEEMLQYSSLQDRIEYLLLHGYVGEDTFGSRRYLNQSFYQSYDWKKTRRRVILRDNGCNLALPEYPINHGEGLVIHHINPITIDDIINGNPEVYSLNNLVCVSRRVHDAIHYGDASVVSYYDEIERRPNDTCPWKEA